MGERGHQKALDKCILDYMKRKNMHETAEIFAQEANVDNIDNADDFDSPEGFFTQWWSLFWDMYGSKFLRANEVHAGESSSKAVAPTRNVPQNFPPIMPRPPMSQQTTGNMQPNPFAFLPRPELIQQAMNAMQTPFPMLPRPEMIQQAMNTMQTPRPILSMSETNQQIMSGMPMSMPDVSANFPASSGFGVQHGEMPTLFSKMYEQEYLKRSARDLAANFRLLDVEKMTKMLPSSSKSSHQPQISVEIQRQKMFEKIQQQLPIDGGHGINLESSKAAVPILQEAHQATLQERKVSDAGSATNSNASSSFSY